jgi:hypothetical protein
MTEFSEVHPVKSSHLLLSWPTWFDRRTPIRLPGLRVGRSPRVSPGRRLWCRSGGRSGRPTRQYRRHWVVDVGRSASPARSAEVCRRLTNHKITLFLGPGALPVVSYLGFILNRYPCSERHPAYALWR